MSTSRHHYLLLTFVLGLANGCSEGSPDGALANSGDTPVSSPSSESASSSPAAIAVGVESASSAESAVRGNSSTTVTAPTFPTTLPTLSGITESLNLAELKPSSDVEHVFLGRGSLSYSTSKDQTEVADRIRQQFAERGFQSLDSHVTAMRTLTFKKDDRPATIMISRGQDPKMSIVEMHFWGEVDLAALSELPSAIGISRTKASLRYAVPMQVETATKALKAKLAELQWPLARTSSTNGSLNQYFKGGVRFSSHVSRMENQELEIEPQGTTASTNVYITSGPHLDMDKLPTPHSEQTLHASSFTSLQSKRYLATGSPKDTLTACETELQKQGWKQVRPIRPPVAEMQKLFAKNACLLQIQASATQDGKSEVQYYTSMAPFDTPAELEMRAMRVDTAAPHLSFVTTSEDITQLTDFYVGHLQRTGWTLSDKQRFDSEAMNMRVFHGTHYYPVLLEIQQKGPKETWVELRPVEANEIAALLDKARQPSAAKSDLAAAEITATEQTEAATQQRAEADRAEGLNSIELAADEAFGDNEIGKQIQNVLDQVTNELENAGGDSEQANQLIAELQAQMKAISAAAGAELPAELTDALAADSVEVETPPEPDPGQGLDTERGDVAAADTPPEKIDETHGVVAENFPIPQGAEDLQRKANLESISYYTNSIRPDAEFFVKELEKLGFRPRGDSDVDDEFGFMQFQKGNGTIRISMMSDERNKPQPVRVMIMGDGLLWPGADDPYGINDDSFLAEGDDESLAEDSESSDLDDFANPTDQDGIPLPQNLESMASSGTPFLQEVVGTKQGALKPFITFFRDQLGAKDWTESQQKSSVAETKAALVFTKGGAVISIALEQFGDEVDLKITKRDAEKAKEAGILPAAGQARIILANASSGVAKITIAGKTYELAAGLGTEDPADGKKIDLPAGTHDFTIQAGAEKQQDKIQVEVGGTWGVIILDDGVHFADRVY